jgi:hypothetical protein
MDSIGRFSRLPLGGLALGTVNTGAGVGAAIAPHLPSLTFLVSDPPGVRRPIAGNEGSAR